VILKKKRFSSIKNPIAITMSKAPEYPKFDT